MTVFVRFFKRTQPGAQRPQTYPYGLGIGLLASRERLLLDGQRAGFRTGLPTATQAGSFSTLVDSSSETTAAADIAAAQHAAAALSSRSGFAHQGEGLGLSIVKGLCKLLQASLEIDEGTLFRIRLSVQANP